MIVEKIPREYAGGLCLSSTSKGTVANASSASISPSGLTVVSTWNHFALRSIRIRARPSKSHLDLLLFLFTRRMVSND